MAKLFDADHYFYIRAPISAYKEFDCLKDVTINDCAHLLGIFDTKSFVREAILISSPSLYHSLKNRPLKNPKKDLQKLMFFLIRMCSRATPYGMFAFVTYGQWDEKTNLNFNWEKIKKHVRPDMEWLYSFLKEDVKNQQDIKKIMIYVNPLLKIAAGRVHLEFSLYESDNGLDKRKIIPKVSIKNTILVEKILSLTKDTISVLTLLDQLEKEIVSLDREKTIDMIDQLITHQVILRAYLPPLTYTVSPYQYSGQNVIEKEYYEKCLRHINHYEVLSIGHGEHELMQACAILSESVKKSNPLQVDLTIAEEKITLNQKVKVELTNAVEMLWTITQITSFYHGLDQYHAAFIEKYGQRRLVPLKELLNGLSGLGHFTQSEYLSSNVIKTTAMNAWEDWLNTAVDDSVNHQTKEIRLTKSAVERLIESHGSSPSNKNEAINSFDVFFKIKASSLEDIESGNFNLYIYQTTQQAHSSMSRFLPYFNDNIKNNVKNFFIKESSIEKGSICSGISFWPDKVRNANVMIHPLLRENILDLQNTPSQNNLTLDDIYIASDGKRFYSCTKNGEEINICFDNLLNLEYAPPEAKFLHRIKLQKYLSVYPFTFPDSFRKRTFLPRVVYNKSILHKARWRLHHKHFFTMNIETILVEFAAWRKKWNLPQFVEVGAPENSLLLNLKNSSHCYEIAQWLKDGEELIFSESVDHAVLNHNSHQYCAEFVVPFIKNPIFSLKNGQSSFPPYVDVPYEKERILPFHKDWLFIKCYLPYENMDAFLLDKINPLFVELEKQFNIEKKFFLRYSDPKPHIRLRIKINETISIDHLFKFLSEFFDACLKTHYLKDINLAIYERELFRYGGLENIDAIEDIFCADSKATLKTVALYNRLGEVDRITLFSASAYFYMSTFFMNEKELISFIKSIKTYKINQKNYNNSKRRMIEFICDNTSDQGSSLVHDILVESTLLFYNPLTQAVRDLSNKLNKMDFLNIINSLLHMHCNRLGCSIHEEQLVTSYLRHVILNIHHLKREEESVSLT